ncbi:MAG: hypothetical protein HQ522_20040 [Bacteroidetes bacterium]|nr:hypothetical protein [Bacteroidota bacterium]
MKNSTNEIQPARSEAKESTQILMNNPWIFYCIVWLIPLITGLFFNMEVIYGLIVHQIPENLVIRSADAIIADNTFSLVPRLIAYPFLSVFISLISIRYKIRYLLFAFVCGLVAMMLGWYWFAGGIIESWLTTAYIGSTFLLAFLLVPFLLIPCGLAGVLVGLTLNLLYTLFTRYPPPIIYRSVKRKSKSPESETLVLTLLSLTVILLCAIFLMPVHRLEKARSPRVSQQQINRIYQKAKANENHQLLLTVSSNPVLPGALVTDIWELTNMKGEIPEKDKIWAALAANTSAPSEVLIALAELNIREITTNIAGNPNTPEELLIRLSKVEKRQVINSLLTNRSLPLSVLDSLSTNENNTIRLKVAIHPGASMEILERLSHDRDLRVQENAVNRLKK